MKLWLAGLGIFLFLGLAIAMFSTYKASVEGLMKKVGLVGSDFGAAIVTEKITQAMLDAKSTISCDLASRMKGSVQFMFAGEQEQGRLSFELGQARVKCAADMLARGDAENGTYEMIRGIGYLNQGYHYVNERMPIDSRVCEGLPGVDTDEIVRQVLEATSGKVYEIIWKDWNDLVNFRTPVVQACQNLN